MTNQGQKPKVGQASPSKAEEAQPAKASANDIPRGCCAVYVAIPDTVGTGDSSRMFADPKEELIVTEKNADQLEMRELAFRDKEHAGAKYTMWKRRKEQEEREAQEIAARRAGLRILPEGTEER